MKSHRDKVRALAAKASDTALTPEEFESLKEVSKGMMQRRIPPEHKKTLLEAGLITEGLGGLGLTTEGQLRVALSK